MSVVCCCSLAGTAACMRCPNNPMSTVTWWPQWQWPQNQPGWPYKDNTLPSYPAPTTLPIQPPVEPLKKVIEEFDGEGKLIKRTTIG